jgi:hypothetical protein
MDTKIWDRDPATLTEELFHYDNESGAITIESRQDVTLAVEANKADFNAAPERWAGDMHRVAAIPVNVY